MTPDVAVVIPLKLVYTPVDATVTVIRNYQVPSRGWAACVGRVPLEAERAGVGVVRAGA
jgi:hypothetical protein